jgi:site-specific DNA-methyltransferase (adenine-specific)
MSSRLAVGARDDWQTPAVVLDRVRRVAPIGLDPCTAPSNPVGATTWIYDGDGFDGLAVTWCGFGLVYANPPYSAMSTWAKKIVAEAQAGAEIISLVGARPDARWFFELAWDTAQAICFWKGRLRFVGAPSSAPFPSALVYHGPRPWAFEAAFADAGKVVRL